MKAVDDNFSAIPDQMIPAVLYKYREDGPFTEKIIIDRQVWLSTPDQLNDPLECQTGVLPAGWKRQQIEQNESAQILGFLGWPGLPPKTLFSLDPVQTRRWLKVFKKGTMAQKIRRMRRLYEEHGITLSDPSRIFADMEERLRTVGILSLSASGNNHPLWAHYAGNHTGLALGFSSEDGGPLGDADQTLPVIYSDTKPDLTGGYLNQVTISAGERGRLASEGGIPSRDPVFRASLSTKPVSWAYEEEWRYVHPRAGLHDLPGRLVSVTFAARMPAERKAYYRRLLRDRGFDVTLSEVRLVGGGMEVVRVDRRS